MIDIFVKYWIPILATSISFIGLGFGARRLEYMVKNKKSAERKDMYTSIRNLELSASDQRSETKRIEQSYDELREGCQVLEQEVYKCIALSNDANASVRTLTSIAKRKAG